MILIWFTSCFFTRPDNPRNRINRAEDIIERQSDDSIAHFRFIQSNLSFIGQNLESNKERLANLEGSWYLKKCFITRYYILNELKHCRRLLSGLESEISAISLPYLRAGMMGTYDEHWKYLLEIEEKIEFLC